MSNTTNAKMRERARTMGKEVETIDHGPERDRVFIESGRALAADYSKKELIREAMALDDAVWYHHERSVVGRGIALRRYQRETKLDIAEHIIVSARRLDMRAAS